MKFSTLINGKLTNYTNATELKQLVPTFIKKAIEHCEMSEIPKGGLVAACQDFVNSYGENMIEMQIDNENEVKYTICCVDEVTDHICNMGWILIDKVSINNKLQRELVLDWFIKKGIKDYEYVIS